MNPIEPKTSQLSDPSEAIDLDAPGNGKGVKRFQHYASKYVELVEDAYGTYYDETGKASKVHRFTWKNFNKIQVQVITYGARVISMKMPDRRGVISDILLGLDDLPSYLADNLYFGAIVGRFANLLGNGTFVIDGKEYWVHRNAHPHHRNGGYKGFDKKIWTPYVDGKRLILSYVSDHNEEGYPGALFVRVAYELSQKNEFSVDIEAFCSTPTIINITNALYFNLADHSAGAKELYKHILTVNSNCYTVTGNDGIPTGEIKNVFHTDLDFQVPRILGNIINRPDGGLDQNLCVNRAVNQDNCFVTRISHPPTGKLLEIYSNQNGVNVYTANSFGSGFMVSAPPLSAKSSKEIEEIFDLIGKLHTKMVASLTIDGDSNYAALKELIEKLQKKASAESGQNQEALKKDDDRRFVLSPLQLKYLEDMRDTCLKDNSLADYFEVAVTIQNVINLSLAKDPLEYPESPQEVRKSKDVLLEEHKQAEQELFKKMADEELKKKGLIRMENKKPADTLGRIVGKNGAVYKRHGAICLQTQNYPNAVAYKNFPNCILRPGQTYKHSIVYKLWVKAGDPTQWVRHINKHNEGVNFGV